MAGPSPNPRVFGKYEVIRRLAVGGMGEIFLARQVGMAGFDRLVILKSLLPQLASEEDMLSQFLDEGRIVGSINHPNVVACYEVGEWEGVYFIAMEYINGVDLAMLQKTCDDIALRFPVNVAMTIMREAALGLDSAHQAQDAQGRALKIVHRDISPHNVMVRQDGLTKIVDFGVAVAANRQRRTEGGLLKGKLGYMAPEQIKGQPLDGRSDQFSLGVLFWELLTGRRLFTAEDPHAVFMKIVREQVPAPSSIIPDVPADVDALVLKMTAQEPTDRYGRLAEVAAALRKLLDGRAAQETETPDLVRGLVGAQLAERVRDLTPSPVRILGVGANAVDGPAMSATFCPSCGEQSVRGDRFCRACGTPLGSAMVQRARTPRASTPPSASDASSPDSAPPTRAAAGAFVSQPSTAASIALHQSSSSPSGDARLPSGHPGAPVSFDDESFVDEVDDLIDVAMDDGPTEKGVCLGIVELVDGAGTHVPPDTLLRPVFAHLEELAARVGGTVTTSGPRITVSFTGNGRGARSALAFARRAAILVARPNRDLKLRAAVSAIDADEARDDFREFELKDHAERALMRARSGTVLVTEQARRLAAVAHAWAGRVQLSAGEDSDDVVTAFEVPLPPRLAGRGVERALVEQAIGAADLAKGTQLLFIGDAGQGKTALLDLVDGDARDRGLIVARARCGRSRGVVRYDAVRQAIKSACRELLVVHDGTAPFDPNADWKQGLEQLSLNVHERARIAALVDSGTTGVTGLVTKSATGDAGLPLGRRRVLLRAAILTFWQSLAEKRGACVLLDDVHRGDPSSLEVFAEVGARLHAARFAMFATSRPMQGARVLPLAKRAVLEPLEARDAALVASIALGGNLNDDVGNRIAAAACGSPLFAALLARHLRDVHLLHAVGGEVAASPDLASYPMPPSLPVLLFAAHALLPKDSRDVLVAAAQLGTSFSAAELATVLGADPKAALRACVSSGALLDEGAGRFAFHTASEREVLAARADPKDARAWHAALARSLGTTGTDGGVDVEERIIEHANAAEDRAGAGNAAARAADAWVALGAVDAAVDHYRRALHAEWKLIGTATAANGGTGKSARNSTGEPRAAVTEESARRVLDLARRATTAIAEIDASAAADLIMPLARALPVHLAVHERAEAVRARAAVLLKLRRIDDAHAVLEEALHMFEKAGPATQASLLIDAGLVLEQGGNPDAARKRLEDALRLLGNSTSDRTRVSEAMIALGRIHVRARRGTEARDVLQLALEEAKRRGAASSEIDIQLMLGSLDQQENEPAKAAQILEQAVETAARIGDGIAEARVRQQLARALQQAGRTKDALATARASLAGATRLAWDEGVAVAHQLVTNLS